MELGKAWVQIVPSAEGISGSIQKVLDPEAAAAGVGAGSKIVGSIKKMLVGAGIGAVLKSTITEGANLQQSLGGLDTIYGDAAVKAKEYAEAAVQAGVSTNNFAEQAVSFGAALKQAYEGDTAKAVEAANMAILDMTDNAAKMGTPLQSLQDAYQGFAKQNYTMLDNLKLGYGGTKTEMERLLADAEQLSGVHYDISNLGDVYNAIHVIQEELGLTGVAADEAKHTLSGSFAAMKAAAANLMGSVTLGEGVKESMATLSETTINFAKNLIPAIGNVLSALPTVFLTAFDSLYLALHQGLNNAITAVQENGPQLVAAFMQGLLQFSGRAQAFAGHLVDDGLRLIKALADGIIQNIPVFIQTVPTIISNFSNIINQNAPKVIATAAEIIKNLAIGLVKAIPVLIQNIPQILKAIWDAFMAFQWLSLGKTVITAIMDGIKAMGTSLPNILKSLGKKAIDAFKGVSWGSVGKTAVNLIVKAITGLASLPATALKKAASLGMKAFTSISWSSVGSNIVKGIAKGITAGLSVIVNAAKSAAKKALDAAKSALGISSPSKVFRDQVGKNIATGWAAGIDKNASLVTRAVSGIDSAITDIPSNPIDYSATAGYGGAFASGAAAGTNKTVQITNYITIENADDPERVADTLCRTMKLQMRSA